MKETEMLETQATVETVLRWSLTYISNCRESCETRNRDIGRRSNGSRIRHSTLRLGEPATWERS